MFKEIGEQCGGRDPGAEDEIAYFMFVYRLGQLNLIEAAMESPALIALPD
jgi:hypothetical protein